MTCADGSTAVRGRAGGRGRRSASGVLAVLGVVVLLLAACGTGSDPVADPTGDPTTATGGSPGTDTGTDPTAADPTAADPTAVTGGPGTFAVVGDSLTAGVLAIPDRGGPGAGSWVPAADVAPLSFAGGWAVPGATTADMLQAPLPTGATDLVVLAGTNDLGRGVDQAVVLANIEEIVTRSAPERVLVLALPPLDPAPAAVQAFNPALADLAAERGWSYLDPWADVRDGGSFTAGASTDGVHPSLAVADAAGALVRAQLLDGGAA